MCFRRIPLLEGDLIPTPASIPLLQVLVDRQTGSRLKKDRDPYYRHGKPATASCCTANQCCATNNQGGLCIMCHA